MHEVRHGSWGPNFIQIIMLLMVVYFSASCDLSRVGFVDIFSICSLSFFFCVPSTNPTCGLRMVSWHTAPFHIPWVLLYFLVLVRVRKSLPFPSLPTAPPLWPLPLAPQPSL
ncbi:hypothetical protein BDR22DRAFT_261257 [Usnea florida]